MLTLTNSFRKALFYLVSFVIHAALILLPAGGYLLQNKPVRESSGGLVRVSLVALDSGDTPYSRKNGIRTEKRLKRKRGRKSTVHIKAEAHTKRKARLKRKTAKLKPVKEAVKTALAERQASAQSEKVSDSEKNCSSEGVSPSSKPSLNTGLRKTASSAGSFRASEPSAKAGVLPVSLPVPVYSVKPHYPYLAKKRGYEGRVVLRLLVGKDGRVKKAVVVKSSGYGILDREAVKALSRWVFEPAKVAGAPVDYWVEVPVVFKRRRLY